MEIIEKEESLVFMLPFKMKYFYLYNDEYFKNKNINAKISVLIKSNAIMKGGAFEEKKYNSLSVPYKYVYYIMEKIRGTISSSTSTPKENVSDEKVFTTYVNENKSEIPVSSNKKRSFFSMINPFGKSEKPDEQVIISPTSETKPEETKSTSFFNIFKSQEPKNEIENIPISGNVDELNEMDINETDKLEKNSDNLLLKVEIFGNVKKVDIENRSYIEREKIINEIVSGEHFSTNENNNQENSGGVYTINNEIIVFGELSIESINKLKNGIEYTDAYNKISL